MPQNWLTDVYVWLCMYICVCVCIYVCVCVSLCCCLVAKSCPTHLQPHGLKPTGSSVHGNSQERILEWVPISFSREFSWLGGGNYISWIGRWIPYHWDTWEEPLLPRTHRHAACASALSPQWHWKSIRSEPASTIYYQRHTAKCPVGPELKIKVCKLWSLTSLRANNEITW